MPDLPALLVDAHAHIFHRQMPLINNPRHKPQYDFFLEQYLEQLDSHGIHYGVIAAASPWGDYNDYTEESVGITPRLRGTVIMYPGKKYDFTRLSRNGMLGIRLPFIGLPQLPDISSPDWQVLFRQLADHNWHVHLHVEGKHIPALLPVLENAGPRIVIDHLGRPAPDEPVGSPAFTAIVDSVKRGKSWIKASCAYRIGPVADEHFDAFLKELGPERLFWASDCPFVGHEKEVSYQQTIDWLDERLADEKARRLIFGENAYRFYFS
jgi:predicted TIM-barrel fold metal-dependent hydrolase